MSCVVQTLGTLPGLNQWSGLEPICKIPPSGEFQQIQCPLQTKHKSSKLCDLLPPGVTNSIYDFLANLPVILLFVASVPARFIYCIVYNFLLNFDQFVLGIEYSIINPILDFFTAPLVYLAIGLADGENNTSFSPPYLVGILTDACLPGFVSGIYQAIGDIFYTIGYGIGFILGLFIDLYDIILYTLCFITTLSLSFGFCIAVSIDSLVSFGGGIRFTIAPFSFLALLLQNYINCGCVLGQYPSLNAVFCLDFGGSCPNECECGLGFIAPTCSPIPSVPPPQSTTLSVTGSGQVSESISSQLSEIQSEIQQLQSEQSSSNSGNSGSGSGGSGSGENSGSGNNG